MDIQSIILNNKYDYKSNLNTSKNMTSSIAYEDFINSRIGEDSLEQKDKIDDVDLDNIKLMDEARMNSLAQYNNYNNAREQIKIKQKKI